MSAHFHPFTPTTLPAKARPVESKHSRRARAATWRKQHGGYSIGGK